jgi:hypothetical protein
MTLAHACTSVVVRFADRCDKHGRWKVSVTRWKNRNEPGGVAFTVNKGLAHPAIEGESWQVDLGRDVPLDVQPLMTVTALPADEVVRELPNAPVSSLTIPATWYSQSWSPPHALSSATGVLSHLPRVCALICHGCALSLLPQVCSLVCHIWCCNRRGFSLWSPPPVRLCICSFGWQAKHVADALTATRQTYAIMAAVVAFLAYLIFG